jgi:hypothetical protein
LEDDVAADTVDLKKEVKEQRMRQIAGQLELEEFDEINDTHQGILTCQSYLREERPEVSCSCLISMYGLSTPVPLRYNALPPILRPSHVFLTLVLGAVGLREHNIDILYSRQPPLRH